MLNVPDAPERAAWGRTDAPHVSAPSEPAAFHWVPQLFGFLRRRWRPIATTAAILVGLAVLYIVTAEPLYTATTRLLIDTEQGNPFQNRTVVAESQAENALVESQVEVLRSDDTARAIVAKLDLTRHPAFTETGGGLLSGLRALLGSKTEEKEPSDAEVTSTIAEALQKSMTIRRIGLSYVIEISVRAPDPQLSARLANAATETYFTEQLQTRQQTTQRAGRWLEERLRELSDQAIAADQAVEEYKARNNLVGTQRGLINEQQLGDVNGQLAHARGLMTDALSRLERIQSISLSGITEGSVGEALQNSVIVRLRQQYLDFARREAEFAGRYGVNHTAAVNLRAEMNETQRAIQSELDRIKEAYRSDYEVARASVTSLETQVRNLVALATEANESRIMLRALERAADSYRTIYSNFLQRYTQVVQDQSFPITDARVIAAAEPPRRKSHPRSAIVLAGTTVFGMGLGLAIAFLREATERGFRTPAQLRTATGLECLGLVPRLGSRLRLRRRRERGRAGIAGHTAPGGISTSPSPFRQVLLETDGRLAEALWAVKLRADRWERDRRDSAQIIGCVAALPREGASTVAANLAQCIAAGGQRVVLVDLDYRQATLTRALVGNGAAQEVLSDLETGMCFVPAPRDVLPVEAVRRIGSAAVRSRLEEARAEADYVIVDLPAVLAHLDASAVADAFDAMLLVVEWGRTDQAALTETLDRLGAARVNVLGAVFNKVRLRALPRYGVPGSTR